MTEGVDVIVLDPVDSSSAAGHGHPREAGGHPGDQLRPADPRRRSGRVRGVQQPRGRQAAGRGAGREAGRGRQPGRARSSRSTATRRTTTRSCSRKARRRCSTRRASTSPRSTTRPTGCPRTPSSRWSSRSPRSARTASTASSPPTTALAGGVIAALKGAGIDPSTIPVTGQDAELAGIQRVLAGEQYMTVYKPIKPLAENAAELAVAVVNGEDPAESDVINGTEDNGTEEVAGRDHRHDPGVPGQRQRHGGQGRLLDGAGDLHGAVRPGLQGRGHRVAR